MFTASGSPCISQPESFPFPWPTLQVPEIISTLRQAGKSSARNDDVGIPFGKAAGGGGDPSEMGFSSVSTATAATTASRGPVSPTAFAKKFEVLFCGRVTVADKKAPPALIDECIEKFSQLHGSGPSAKADGDGGLVGGLKRALALPANGLRGGGVGNGYAGSPKPERRPVPSFPCLQDLDENGLSPEISHCCATDSQQQCTGVQPTSLQENRTMLFTVSHIYTGATL